MAVEFFSWPSLRERMCRTWGSNWGRLHAKRTRFRSSYRARRSWMYMFLIIAFLYTFPNAFWSWVGGAGGGDTLHFHPNVHQHIEHFFIFGITRQILCIHKKLCRAYMRMLKAMEKNLAKIGNYQMKNFLSKKSWAKTNCTGLLRRWNFLVSPVIYTGRACLNPTLKCWQSEGERTALIPSYIQVVGSSKQQNNK